MNYTIQTSIQPYQDMLEVNVNFDCIGSDIKINSIEHGHRSILQYLHQDTRIEIQISIESWLENEFEDYDESEQY